MGRLPEKRPRPIFHLSGYRVNQELVHPNEGRATFDATVFAFAVDALVIGDKTYSYHLLLSATGGTVHDSDMRDIVDFCYP